jgi:TolB-like protein
VVGSGDYWPAIAVLPFDEFSDTPGPLGAGIAAEIITELARCRDLKVLARHTSFGAAAQRMVPADITRKYGTPYLLEGTIRCVDGRLVVSVQLIDGHDSRLLWAERFFAPTEAAFADQGGLITRITSRVHSEVREAEMTTALRSVPADLDVHELVRRGVAHWRASNRPSYLRARAEVERAVELDPSFALARIFLGGLNASDAAFCVTGTQGPDALPALSQKSDTVSSWLTHQAMGITALGLRYAYRGIMMRRWTSSEEALHCGPIIQILSQRLALRACRPVSMSWDFPISTARSR